MRKSFVARNDMWILALLSGYLSAHAQTNSLAPPLKTIQGFYSQSLSTYLDTEQSHLERMFWENFNDNFQGLTLTPQMRYIASGDAFDGDIYEDAVSRYAHQSTKNTFTETLREAALELPLIHQMRNLPVFHFITDSLAGGREHGLLASPGLSYYENTMLFGDPILDRHKELRLSAGMRLLRTKPYTFATLKYGPLSTHIRAFPTSAEMAGQLNITKRIAIAATAKLKDYEFPRYNISIQYRLFNWRQGMINYSTPQSLFRIGASWNPEDSGNMGGAHRERIIFTAFGYHF